MENDQKLSSYIFSQLQQGQTPDVISSQLTNAGWPEQQIKQAFLTVQSQTVPANFQPATVQHDSAVVPKASGRRRGRIKTGWQILIHCIKLLNGNRYLLRYFIMTWVLVLALEGILLLVLYLSDPAFFESSINYYALAFVTYLVAFCIINFYAAALARNILDIYEGKKQPYAVYLKAARSKFWPIFVYSLISAVIGVILEWIIERLGWLGRIVSWLLGATWSLATMFTLPIIMDTSSSGPSAIKQSWKLFKQTWGEGITAKATAGLPIAILQFLLAIVFWFFIVLAFISGSWAFAIIILLIYLFCAITVFSIGSFASSFISAALYYYAINKQVPPGFSAELLDQVFVKSKRQLRKEAKANA